MPDHVFFEDGDVALRGLDVEVAEQLCTDVDGQSGIDQVGGQQPAEVVWGERQVFERRVGVRKLGAGALQHLADGGEAEDPWPGGAALEQERHGR